MRGWTEMDLIAATGDLTGDGAPDIVARDRQSRLLPIHPGAVDDPLGPGEGVTDPFAGADQMSESVTSPPTGTTTLSPETHRPSACTPTQATESAGSRRSGCCYPIGADTTSRLAPEI